MFDLKPNPLLTQAGLNILRVTCLLIEKKAQFCQTIFFIFERNVQPCLMFSRVYWLIRAAAAESGDPHPGQEQKSAESKELLL